MTSTSANLVVHVLALLVALVGGHLASANSVASASVGGATSYASAGFMAAPPSRAYARSAAKRPALLDQLVQLEASASTSADCHQWLELNARYVQSREAQPRPAAEYQMERRCEAIERVANFRRRALAEQDQLEFVSDLVSDYVELKRSIESGDSLLEGIFDRTLEEEPQLPVAIGNLQSFGDFLVGKLGGAETKKEPLPHVDDVGQVDATLRRLVDRELELSDAEFQQLVERTTELERFLATKVHVQSGRFRYLSGTLDAARAVIVHKLNMGEQEEAEAESGAEVAQDYVHASAFAGHEPLKVASSASAQTIASVELPRAPKELLYNMQQQQQQKLQTSLPQTIPLAKLAAPSLPQQTRRRTIGDRLRHRKFADF